MSTKAGFFLGVMAVLTAALIYGAAPQPVTDGPRPPAGSYHAPQIITLPADAWATIDGRPPGPHDAGPHPLPLTPPQILPLRLANAAVPTPTTHVYFAGDFPLAQFHLTLDPADLYDPDRGLFVHPTRRGRAWERPGRLDIRDCHETAACRLISSPVGVRVHGGNSRTFPKKSLRVYFRADYGQASLPAPYLLGDDGPVEYEQLVLHAGGQDTGQFAANWTLLRNPLANELAAEIGLITARQRPILLFINGRPWGVYWLRERPRQSWLETQQGWTDAIMLDSPADSGERDPAWTWLQAFAAEHDLADADHYAAVVAQIDMNSFIDYHLLQVYLANTDWPGHNYQIARPDVPGGRWRWVVWDSDYTAGLRPILTTYAAGRVEEDTLARLLAADPATADGQHMLLLQALWANADFRAALAVRMEELLAGPLSPQAVTARIDRLAAQLEPAVVYETGRWPTRRRWTANVDDLRMFAAQRPQILRAHLAALTPSTSSDKK